MAKNVMRIVERPWRRQNLDWITDWITDRIMDWIADRKKKF